MKKDKKMKKIKVEITRPVYTTVIVEIPDDNSFPTNTYLESEEFVKLVQAQCAAKDEKDLKWHSFSKDIEVLHMQEL